MKIYLYNGRKVWLDENNLPEGAVSCEPKRVEKAEPAEVKTKARKTPANKARKAGSNK